jgi:hypothetical protein
VKEKVMRIKLALTVAVLLGIGLSYVSGPLQAQLPMGASTQFDITGFLQEAALDPSCAASSHCGGSLKVNGHVVVVPKEVIVMFPANALTWQETFAQAPLPYTGVATGMASADVPAPLTTYEVHVVGNRVLGGPAGADLYIAGLIFVSQQGLNSGQGFINFMDYTLGEMRVGGVLGDNTTGVRLRFNDPNGRYGRKTPGPDIRFTVDPDNPTISSGTGFPMCFPRVAPSGIVGGAETDPLCPQGNRPAGVISIQTNDPGALPGVFPDATKQVPMEVGDYITYAGTLVTDNAAAPTAGPWPGTASTYIAAHTIESNIAVFTWPGTSPAYVRTDVALIGTGGLTVLGAGEAVIRTRFEGMSTDTSRLVHLYGIDTNPLTGVTTDRDWGTIGVDPGPPNGAVKGRWRFRPPCAVFGTVVAKPDKQCVGNALGTFLPPTREMRAVIEGMQSQVAAVAANDQTKTAANGLFYGQYHAPIFDYIFPENVPGSPIVENNFNTIDFLTLGGYVSAGGTMVGQLNPWPSNITPAPACTAPAASAGGPYTVASGGSLLLAGTSTGTAPVTFAWGVDVGLLANATTAAPTYTAPVVAVQTVANLTLVTTNGCGTSTATSSVVISAPKAPTASDVLPMTVFSATQNNSFTVTGSDPNVPALALTFTVTQAPAVAGGPVLSNIRVSKINSTSATVTFNAPTLAVGQVTPSVVNLTIVAKNSAGVSSAGSKTSVTVNPLPDAIAITTAQYRISKQRIDLTVTDSIVSPNVVLKLQPYVTTSGVLFDPSTLGNTLTNNGGGGYILTLVGAPPPACGNPAAYATPCPTLVLQVKSNVGGASPVVALTNIRQ